VGAVVKYLTAGRGSEFTAAVRLPVFAQTLIQIVVLQNISHLAVQYAGTATGINPFTAILVDYHAINTMLVQNVPYDHAGRTGTNDANISIDYFVHALLLSKN